MLTKLLAIGALGTLLACFAGKSVHAELRLVDPAAIGMRGDLLDAIEPLISPEIAEGNLPGCVVAIGRTGATAYLRAFGDRQIEPQREAMTTDTVFDLASLTKPIATAMSVMHLVERGLVRINDPVAKYLPEFAQNGKADITLEQLLTHQAGLIPDNPLEDYQQGPQTAWEKIHALSPTVEPGTKFVYTDVGFLVLGQLVERVSGMDVASYARQHVFQPLGMRETGYLPDAALRERAAPTEQRDGMWLRGVVHDPRAALLGGVAGHAGLFSTPSDLAVYCDAMLRGGVNDRGRVLSAAGLTQMAHPRDIAGQKRGLGWDMGSKYSSNRGELFSRRAFGHGGFTGTALWIDPDLDLFVIFLSNRLHPDGQGNVNPLAGRIGSIAAASIARPNPLAASNSLEGGRAVERQGEAAGVGALEGRGVVQLGVDVLRRENFAPLAGKRVGLIANHTSLVGDGRRTIDVLHEAPNVELVALFSPEHGLQGQLDQAHIDDTRDAATGLPVYSLYGASRQPMPEQLQDLDALVFDIQDIGTRFYTYISTMGLAMEAAAKSDVEFVVLDRPNPIAGTLVEGPVLDVGRESFVGFHPMPVRHGMTIGELATMFREARDWKGRLTVVETQGWRRGDYWEATGLGWVNPSPNIRNLAQAVLYPGVGLLETTNLSVGRGTDAPFETLGAPWIDGRRLANALSAESIPGVGFVPIQFIPLSSKFANEVCEGVSLTIIDRSKVRPVKMGLTIACILRKLYPEKWETESLDRLLVNRDVCDAVRAGREASELEPLYRAALERFSKQRERFLRYD